MHQSIDSLPAAFKAALTLENGRLPRNPRFAESGEGFEVFFDAVDSFWLGGQEGFVDVVGRRAGGESG